MRPWVLYCSLVVSLTVGVPRHALGQLVYDDFNAANQLIDINKWIGFTGPGRSTEATRRITAGRLQLLARGAGLLAPTPTGASFTEVGLLFPNPKPVTLLQATVQVVDFDTVACPGNTTPSEVKVVLSGGFFNSGTPIPGNPTNDVFAHLQIARRSNAAANTMVVEAGILRCTNVSCSTPANVQNFNLGTLSCPLRICPAVALRITWEPASNRFRFFRGAVGALPASEKIANYVLADAKYAAFSSRFLSVVPLPVNCTAAAGRKTAFIDTRFDNVLTNVVNPGPNAPTEFDAVDLGEVLGPGEIPLP